MARGRGRGADVVTAPLRRTTVLLPFLWLALFALLPLLLVLQISLAQMQLGVPPYTPLWAPTGDGHSAWAGTLANYRLILGDSLYVEAYGNALRVAAVSTLLALLIGFPMAYAIARSPSRWRLPLLILVLLPFWISFLIRVYAWINLLRPGGLLNAALQFIGLTDQPLVLLNTPVAVYLGMVSCYLPYMLLPLYARLEKIDLRLIEAALDLGATPRQAFWRVTVPLAAPGIVAGCLLVFVPAVGEFVIPELLGGAGVLMIGKVLWNEFFINRDWPVAAAVAAVLLVTLALPIAALQARTGERT